LTNTAQCDRLLFRGISLDNNSKDSKSGKQLSTKDIDYLFRVCEIFGYEDNCNFDLLLEKRVRSYYEKRIE
jgi:hypothetical protein